jgi:peptide deformylase
MAIRNIVKYPDPLLRKKAEPVTDFGSELEQLVADMAETMYDAPGAGLAATQIGVHMQVVVMDVSPPKEKDLTVLVNPEIIEMEGEVVDEEGCLSVIEYSAKVKRARKIKVCARDLQGNPLQFEAEDWYARVIQHEVDHLLGILYIDRISALKRSLYKKKLKKLLKEQEG